MENPNELVFRLDKIDYAYPNGQVALNRVNLSIGKGESVAILGANGCGKSTLLTILDGLLFPSAGSFEAFGMEINEERLTQPTVVQQFRSRVGMVFQNSDVQLFCSSVRDELSFGPLQMDLPAEEIRQRIRDVLALLEIEHLVERAPFGLSGGEKKKVAIASVLTMNPQVLLLDEPANGLDPRTQAWLVEFLLHLRQAGKTIVAATHDLSMVDEVADRVVVLDEGHSVVADGPTLNILSNEQLLLRANLIHEHYHHHDGRFHRHLHQHSPGHRHSH
jgi:cobalt/nickel transport system ATP-binding protein